MTTPHISGPAINLIVTAEPGLTASLTFIATNSSDGPWTYTTTQTDVTADNTGPADVTGQTVTDGWVTETVGPLIEGHQYSFQVTITDADGNTSSSPLVGPITATT